MKKMSLLLALIAVAAMVALSCQRDSNPLETLSEDAQLSRAGKKPAPGQAKKATQGSVLHVPGEFATIEDAIDAASSGDKILVGPGEFKGATVTKAVEIKGIGGAVINDGPLPWASRTFKAGFLFPGGDQGDGAKISHLKFETVEFPVFSRGADDVTVEHCTMASPIQGISDWNGNGWNIIHNVINGLRTSNGGGIGIFIGTWGLEETANDNFVSNNKVTGLMVLPDNENGGYTGPGICLMTDGRKAPAGPMSGNRIIRNKVAISSTNSSLVMPVGIELTDYGLYEDPPYPDLVDNNVGFNDVRGVVGIPIGLFPDDRVAENNIISRNLGEDPDKKGRGPGAHPKVFFE
jgi:hypothetical protein